MNLAKRAGLYTIRQKQKTVLLFLVLVLVSTLILTGIAISNAVSDTSADIHRDIAGTITLERNPPELDHGLLVEAMDDGIEAGNRTLIELLNSGDFVTFDMLDAIMAVSGISGYNITAEFTMRDAEPKNFNFLSDNQVGMVNVYGIAEQTTRASIQSATNSERMLGFVGGNLGLAQGRHLTAEDYRSVMISDVLAEYNSIHIGDTLKISGAPTFMGDEVSSVTLAFEVVGIFSGTRAAELYETIGGHVTDPLVLAADTLIIDMQTLLEEYERSNYFGTGVVGSLPGPVSIFIDNPNEIETVYEQIANLPQIYGKDFSLTMGTDGFETVLVSLGSLQGLVGVLLVIIALISMAVIAILLTIWTRGRVKEIGIYLANGIQKRKIVTQFILEVVLIAVVAFAFSLPLSQVAAGGAGDYVLSQFAAAEELRAGQLEGSTSIEVLQGGIVLTMPETGFLEEASIEATLDMVDVAVHGRDLLWVYMIGLPVVIGAVLIASYTVVKLKPREILSKMS